MCGGISWAQEGWRPFSAMPADLGALARRSSVGPDADAPLIRELNALDVFPGVPLH
jgi:hypothetical protein